jgi:hypothetical protein
VDISQFLQPLGLAEIVSENATVIQNKVTIMADLKPCSECGGPMISVDVAGADDRPALIRDNFGRFFSRDSLVHLEHAHACTACGYTRLFVDPEKLKKRAGPRSAARNGESGVREA